MLKKTLLVLSLISAFVFGLNAQSIKGSESVSYFQTPAQGVKFAKGYVFMSYDNVLANAKKEEQQAKNSSMGSNFGALGAAVADAANDGLDAIQSFNTALDAFKDKDGRFATWNFVPAYIIAPTETDKNVNVEIFVMNEPDPSPSARMPTTADKNGYYDVPYYVNCRYKVTSADGTVLHEENLGVLQGTQKTKDYTPAAAPTMGSMSDMTTVTEGIPIQDEIGTNKAYNAVRTAVFARFGFGQFYAPIKLGVVKESKASKKMIGPTLDIFENKAGLILTKEEKAVVKAFADEMEKVVGSASEKTKWVALHNLSVCYAWLEDGAKAKQYYTEYAAEIKTTLDKMECWNLCLAGKMTGKEMKAKCGSTFIGGKDQKKFAQYNNISNFVNYYADGAVKHEQLLKTINRDLARFVDFYGINDLLCQLYEIDFPYQFLPLQDMKGAPKDLKGVITKEGMEPIEYRVKYNNKRKIKELEADQSTVLEDGSKEKLFTREIKPTYDEDGRYSHIETDAGSWARDMSTGGYYTKMNAIYDPLVGATTANINNITKKAGFLGERTSNEKVQLKVDLEGNIFFTGESNYFKANAFFKGIMSANGIVPKRVDTYSKFSTKTIINEQGVMTDWLWTGNVKTSIGAMMSSRAQSLTADEMVRGIKYLETDENGNPTKAEAIFKLKGSMDIEAKMSMKEFFAKSYATGSVPTGEMSSENIDITQAGEWDCTFEYDENQNWTSMKIGPYTATREIKY